MEPVENAVGYTIFTVGSLFKLGGLGVVHAAPEPPGADSLPDSTRRFPTRPGFVRWVLGVPAAPRLCAFSWGGNLPMLTQHDWCSIAVQFHDWLARGYVPSPERLGGVDVLLLRKVDELAGVKLQERSLRDGGLVRC